MDNETLVTFYSHDTLKRFSVIDAYAELKRQKEFSVWLSFIDPRTDCLVQDSFKLYPKSINTYTNGFCYLTEHNGLILEIPSCLKWWASRTASYFTKQRCNILKEGTFTPVTINLEIGVAIRVPMPFLSDRGNE